MPAGIDLVYCLFSKGRELEGLGHEHIVITVLQDQPSVFSSGKGRIYLEGHWQFVTEFVSFCGGNVRVTFI